MKAQLTPKELFQNQSAIVFLISRRVNQGDRACFGFALEQLDQIVFVLELLLITLAELIPLVRIVPEPTSQLRAGRDILQPEIYLRPLLGQAARPEPLDEDALAVIPGGFFISPLQFDHL